MDNQGTIRDVIDNQGTVLNHITYDSFGQITQQTNQTAFFRFGYTGREFDRESGQYYYRARYFDPNGGRFISEDTIGFGGGDTNLYRYVGNSSPNYIDPTGNYIESAWDALSLTVGVASFADNVRRGDLGNAALDGIGIVADTAALALPVPGGIGAARNASRVASFINKSKGARNTIRGAQALNLGVNIGQTGKSAVDTYNEWQESCNGEIPWAGIARTGLSGLGVLGSAGNLNRSLGKFDAFNSGIERSFLGSSEGHDFARSVTPGGTGTAFTGHGKYHFGDGTVTVPEGTAITLPREGIKILDETGRYIEAGDWEGLARAAEQNPRIARDIEGMFTALPGTEVPNYTLSSPINPQLDIYQNSTTVEKSTKLQQLIQPNMGCVQWAACTEF